MLIYRTDNRNPGVLEDDNGFLPKTFRSPRMIKTQFMKWCETGEVIKMVESHQSSAGKGFIISMDKTKFCGGYSKKFFYEMKIPLFKKQEFTAKNLGLKQLSWKGIQQKPEQVHLYMNAPKLRYANIYAISNIGDRKGELSVFSGVPYMNFIRYSEEKSSVYKQIKTRKEYPKPVRGSVQQFLAKKRGK